MNSETAIVKKLVWGDLKEFITELTDEYIVFYIPAGIIKFGFDWDELKTCFKDFNIKHHWEPISGYTFSVSFEPPEKVLRGHTITLYFKKPLSEMFNQSFEQLLISNGEEEN